MILKLINKSISGTVVALCLVFMVGCSSNVTFKGSVDKSSNLKSKVNLQNHLLKSIKKSALQGKVINCDFPVYSTSIQHIQSEIGKSDKVAFIPQIKNSKFYTYSKYNLVFGVKRDQVFEVRSFDNSLKQLPFSMVNKFFGHPEYTDVINGEKIIGYTIIAENNSTKEKYKIKLEFVFSKPVKATSDPILNHYFVLDPRSTADDMANDPGIQW